MKITTKIITNKLVLLGYLPLMVVCLSGCWQGYHQHIKEQGVWEANNIYFEQTNLLINNIKLVISEKTGLQYGLYSSENSSIFNYSIWLNDVPVGQDESEEFTYNFIPQTNISWNDGTYLYKLETELEENQSLDEINMTFSIGDYSVFSTTHNSNDSRIESKEITLVRTAWENE
ncbi:MAG: hypothetical protein LUB56_00655 [Coprobacillus sp.]|nr:hypothetical protein [Coprobacillus sp.]